MFGKRKRPWAKYAAIERIELNNGDVQFVPYRRKERQRDGSEFNILPAYLSDAPVQTLADAERIVDEWWAEWWPQQTKSKRPA